MSVIEKVDFEKKKLEKNVDMEQVIMYNADKFGDVAKR